MISSRSVGSTATSAAPRVCSVCVVPLKALHRASIDGVQQRALIRRHHVDQVKLLRLLVGIRLRILHRLLRRIHVASAHRHVRPQKRQRVVQDLLLHRVVDLAHLDHRMRRARIRSRRHRCNIGRLHQKESRRPGPASRRRHIKNHRRRRCQNVAHHGARRIQQPARRIQLHQHRLRVQFGGPVDPALQIIGADRLNRIVQMQNHHLAALRRHPYRAWPQQAQKEQQDQRNQKKRSVVVLVPYVVRHCSHGIPRPILRCRFPRP